MPSKTLRYAAILVATSLILLAAYQAAVRIRAEAGASRAKSTKLGTILASDDRFDKALREGLVEALKGQQAPLSRLEAFRQFDAPEYRLNGWMARLIEVDEGGSLVKLQVTPIVTSAYGATTSVAAAHEETYRFRDGQLIPADAESAGPTQGGTD